MQALDQRDGFLAICCFPNDLDITCAIQYPTDALPDQVVIVCYNDLDHPAASQKSLPASLSDCQTGAFSLDRYTIIYPIIMTEIRPVVHGGLPYLWT
jgi:hypothetical protein